MTTSVALSPHFESFIPEQIDSGRYNNVREGIPAGLRVPEQRKQAPKLEALQAAVSAGIGSGEGRGAEAVFMRLEKKYRQLAENGREACDRTGAQ